MFTKKKRSKKKGGGDSDNEFESVENVDVSDAVNKIEAALKADDARIKKAEEKRVREQKRRERTAFRSCSC